MVINVSVRRYFQHARFIPIVGVGKRGAYYLSMVTCQGSTRWNYLEVYWPCAGGLSAVNAIGTHLRNPKHSGLTRWRMAVSKLDAAAELGKNPAS